MLQVKTVTEALNLLAQELRPIAGAAQTLPLLNACGYVCGEDVYCREIIPPFNRSTVDGYALRGADSFGAGESMPARLLLKGRVDMGEIPDFALEPGEAAYVPTGGCLPIGADAMVMLEYSEDIGDGYVYLYKAAAPGNNLVFAGDDARPGSLLLALYQRIKAHHIGMLAAAGITEVPVLPRPKVGIIAGGDELADIHQPLQAGQIRDVNSYLIAAALAEKGAVPVRYGIAPDNAATLLALAQKALEECDMLLLSGGSSVGQKDYTQWVLQQLPQSSLLLHGLAVKPGKPTLLAVSQGKPVFGLPGHPLSAYFIFRLFVTRSLEILQGQPPLPPHTLLARMSLNYPSNGGREEYLPVILEQSETGLLARPIFNKSALISMLKQADGYIRISREQEGLAKGEQVEVELF